MLLFDPCDKNRDGKIWWISKLLQLSNWKIGSQNKKPYKNTCILYLPWRYLVGEDMPYYSFIKYLVAMQRDF